jgi:hypothetical protein
VPKKYLFPKDPPWDKFLVIFVIFVVKNIVAPTIPSGRGKQPCLSVFIRVHPWFKIYFLRASVVKYT